MPEETNTAVADATNTGAVTTEKRTSRKYVKLDENGNPKVIKIDAEVANQTTWKEREKAGFSQVSENDFIFYKLTDASAFSSVVTDPDQQLYVINAGLSYIQNGKINRLMKANNSEGPTAALDPAHNGEVIDLLPYINEKPQRRSLTDLEKVLRLLDTLNLDEAQRAAMIAAMTASATDSTEEGEEGDEAEG